MKPEDFILSDLSNIDHISAWYESVNQHGKPSKTYTPVGSGVWKTEYMFCQPDLTGEQGLLFSILTHIKFGEKIEIVMKERE